jgi:hypothetical protein
LFEGACLINQAEQELADAIADRLHRHDVGATMARAIGLGDDEGPLFEVCCYSSDLAARLAAAEMLCGALLDLAASEAA